MKILEKLKKMLPYIICIAISICIPLFIEDKSLSVLMILLFVPAVIFLTSLVYGIKNKFCTLLPLITAILSVSLPFVLNETAWIYIPIYFSISLVGIAIGTVFNKEYKNSQLVQWIVGIFCILLAMAGAAIVILIYGTFEKPNIGYSKGKVVFELQNLSDKNLNDIEILAAEKVCGGNNFVGKLDKNEKIFLDLDFSKKTENCHPPKSDGGFTLTYQDNGQEKEYKFGYYTNGVLTENHFNIIFQKDGTISGVEKTAKEKIEKTTTECQDFTFQKNYLCSYDAGIFSGDDSLSFGNQEAGKIREKVKNNDFNLDWKTISKNELSYPNEDNANPDGKILAEKNGYTVKVKYGNIATEDEKLTEKYIETYLVIKDGKELYSGKTNFTTQEPYKNFVVDEKGDWWFLYNEYLPKNKKYDYAGKNILVHNGKILDYEDVFELQEFNGKVFYFFEKSKTSKINYYFDGKIVETNFSEIIHDRCCEPAMFNITSSADGRIKFWGIVGENFNYNEMYLLGEK